jgi:nucleoside-diphosphate-sugar epimerase
MRVLVTGATGFLGPYLVAALKAANNEVVGLGRGQSPEGNFDALVHASLEPMAHYLAHVQGPSVLLSSGAVVTHGSGYLDGYADTKRIQEVEAFSEGMQIARIFSVLGPGIEKHEHMAASQFLAQAKAGGPVVVKAGAIRSYLYPTDVASAVLTIMELGDGQPYDVGGEEPMNVADLGERIGRAAKVAVYRAEIIGAIDTYLPDLTRLKALGWKQTISTEEAIRRTLDA